MKITARRSVAPVIAGLVLALGAVPLVCAYDDYERVWLPPTPRLLQRRINSENRAFAHSTVLKMLNAAVTRAGLIDPVEGRPLRYTPHDFRRMFITDAIANGFSTSPSNSNIRPTCSTYFCRVSTDLASSFR